MMESVATLKTTYAIRPPRERLEVIHLPGMPFGILTLPVRNQELFTFLQIIDIAVGRCGAELTDESGRSVVGISTAEGRGKIEEPDGIPETPTGSVLREETEPFA
jgi:hypothetical protein